MQHPLILISSSRVMGNLSMSRQQSALYGACLGGAGAAGVLYTGGPSACLAARCDGLLLAGGGDIHPSCFGQSVQNAALSVDPVRDKEERALFEDFYRRRKPILGICRGVQVINVFLGGTLHQDIPAHSGGCHGIRCTGALSALVGLAPTVNSYHHQAVDQPAPCLQTAARASDGIIEALMHATAPILGVQWHPERMVPPFCEDVAGANHLPLFHWLIERC